MKLRTFWVFRCSLDLDDPEPHAVVAVKAEQMQPWHHLTAEAAARARDEHLEHCGMERWRKLRGAS
jgi:hypothetical protein